MDVSSIALQGLQQSQLQLENTAQRLSNIGSTTPDGATVDNVDLSQQAVSLLTAKNQFAANLNVLKIADQMQKSTMNLVG